MNRPTSVATRAWLLAAVLCGCTEPEDVLFKPPVVEPVDEGHRFRLTNNPGPDVVRGFTPDGERILYRSHGLTGFGEDWRILSVPVGGGPAREEGAQSGRVRDSVIFSILRHEWPGVRQNLEMRLAAAR